MQPAGVKTFLFQNEEQWRSGLFAQLQFQKDTGLTLFKIPTFQKWIETISVTDAAGIGIDSCERLYYLELEASDKNENRRRQASLFVADLHMGTNDRIVRIPDSENFDHISRIYLDPFTIWLWNRGANRIYLISRENNQIKSEIRYPSWNIIDIALTDSGSLYALIRVWDQLKIVEIDNHGRYIRELTTTLRVPVQLCAGSNELLYTIDQVSTPTEKYWKFFAYNYSGKQVAKGRIRSDFVPTLMTINSSGNMFVYNEATSTVVQFDPEGSEIGPLASKIHPVVGMVSSTDGKLFLISERSTAIFESTITPGNTGGTYYGCTLDSGINGCSWHRASFRAQLPPSTVVEVRYDCSDDHSLKDRVVSIFDDKSMSVYEKAEQLDGILKWSDIQSFSAEQFGRSKSIDKAPELLFMNRTGRYLWMRVQLKSFGKSFSPSISSMRISYPRDSYLRYLPAIYQEDPTSRDFLERFLALFESVFVDLESEINRIFQLFDPARTPEDFLPWLGSWLNLIMEEDWSPEMKRRFISEASKLYKYKGTSESIRLTVRLLTGSNPMVVEHTVATPPLVVRGQALQTVERRFALGVNTILWKTTIRNFRLGDDSIVGYSTVKDPDSPEFSPDHPFVSMTNRFTVVLGLSHDQFRKQKYVLSKFLDHAKPAHTSYSFRLSSEMQLGINSFVEITTKISSPKPFTIGYGSILGASAVTLNGEEGGRIERSSYLEKNLRLI